MVSFRQIKLSDREWIDECLKKGQYKSCDFSFVNNYIWSIPNQITFADVNGFYCLKSKHNDGMVYTFPVGDGDVKPVIEILMEDAKENGMPFVLRGIPQCQLEKLEALFPGQFDISEPREESDYIYLTEKLTTLSGKKLHGKRNHIARFKDNPDWSYEDINEDNINDCRMMNKEWCSLYNCEEDTSLQQEACAVTKAFNHFFELNLSGGLLRLAGKVVAYTIGEQLTEDTFVVHIEKAFPGIQGAYPMINQQFVIHNCQDYMYVNREEDMGEEGLRKAKLSYYPEIIYHKYKAVLK